MSTACQLIELPVRRDERGALAFGETGKQFPFEVRREFHLFDLKAGVARGGHAHKTCHQFLVAMAGEFSVLTDDGIAPRTWVLAAPDKGLHVPPGYWVELTPLSSSAVLSVLASHCYDEADYIRDRECFEEWARVYRSGAEVHFGEFDRQTLDLSFDWLADPEIRRLTDSPVIERAAQLRWFEGLSARLDYKVWTVTHKGKPVGAVGLKRIEAEKAEYFGYIGVKSCWGKGIGSAMIEFAEIQARCLGLDRLELRVIDDNPRARALYLRRGFVSYQTGDGYCLMAKNIGR
jgi:RimJ/RimL family protein N-acetyltransferase/dTDP-4-dehydrorhamnose 3,5-epimerase-like enzyme